MTRQLEVQRLAGLTVHDTDGRNVGRIEGISAESLGARCVVTEYRLGTAALLARLGIGALGLLGWTGRREPLRVPWNVLDLSDPDQPRLRCTRAELEALQGTLPPV